jgi:hypothetical protein
MVVPWLAKNAVIVGNPFSPFANRYFPNPYIRISFEEDYRRMHRWHAELKTAAQLPMELTVRGGILQGFLGPVFLLAPLGLLALRWPLGRHLVFAALFFAIPYPANLGTRFLFGATPFIAYALGLVLTHWRIAAPAVILFHAFFSWPTVAHTYCDPYAWRLDKVSTRPAFRRETQDEWLPARIPEYATAKMIEQHVPPDGRVFTFGGVPQAYCRREIMVAYEAGLNNVIGDILLTPVMTILQPLRRWTFQFPERRLRGVRVVQTAATSELWSVSELRVFGAGGEVPRAEAWRIKAAPNPWDVQMAFDNCPVTRWRTWEAARPGQYLEVTFGAPQAVSGVRVELTLDQRDTRAGLQGQTEAGEWVTISTGPQVTAAPVPKNMGRLAVDDLKRFGITHLSVSNNEFFADDIFDHRGEWGLALLGEAGGSRLYKLE